MDILTTEYKEMRSEIRTAYSQYYSIVFGVMLTGVVGAFYLAFDKTVLFLAIPIMILSWFSIALIMRLNIQHIAAYIATLEHKINQQAKVESLSYESDHVKKLWFSPWIKILGLFPTIMIIGIYIICLYKGYQYLNENDIIIFGIHSACIKIVFVVLFVVMLFVIMCFFVILPERLFKKEYKYFEQNSKS